MLWQPLLNRFLLRGRFIGRLLWPLWAGLGCICGTLTCPPHSPPPPPALCFHAYKPLLFTCPCLSHCTSKHSHARFTKFHFSFVPPPPSFIPVLCRFLLCCLFSGRQQPVKGKKDKSLSAVTRCQCFFPLTFPLNPLELHC